MYNKILKIIKNNKKIIYILTIILFFIMFLYMLNKPKNEKINNNIKEEIPINTEIKKNSVQLFDSINNMSKIESAKINSQLKFLSVKDNTYIDLLSFGVNANLENINNKTNLKGEFKLDLKTINIALNFPIIINNLANKEYEIYMEIPSAYKESFDMNQTQEYLYISKTDLNKTKELYNLDKILNNYSTSFIDNEKENFNKEEKESLLDVISKIEYEELDKDSGIYNISLNNKDILMLYEIIQEDKTNNNKFVKLFMDSVLKNKDNINKMSSFKGQIAVSKDKVNDIFIATDIYIEIENYSGSVIAFRLTLNNINDKNIKVKSFENKNIKTFYDFMNGLNNLQKSIDKDIKLENIEENNLELTEEMQQNQNNSDDINPYNETTETDTNTEDIDVEKTITIGEIFFTGEDESLKKDSIIPNEENNENNQIFDINDLGNKVNVFINFSDCTKKTNLTVKWFFNNQEVPIVENKLSNGEYEEGILKSSISFTNAESIALGTYTLKIYLDDKLDNELIKEASFTITGELKNNQEIENETIS